MGVVWAPIRFALRRMGERPLAVATIFLAAAAAAGLVGWSSLAAALAQEQNVRTHLRDTPETQRALRVVYFTQPLVPDSDGSTVAAAVRSFRDVTTAEHHVRIWHPVAPADERGTRLVVSDEPGADVAVEAGRLPASGCTSAGCPALALSGRYRLGERVRLGGTTLRITGLGSLRPTALSDRAQVGNRALLVRSLDRPLRRLLRQVGSTVVTTAPLDPDAVRGFELGLLLPPPGAGRSDDGGIAGELDAGLGRCPPGGLRQHGGGPGRGARPHRRARPVRPAQHLRRRPDDHARVRATGIGTEKHRGR